MDNDWETWSYSTKTWVTINLSKIFPAEHEHIELLKAVWEDMSFLGIRVQSCLICFGISMWPRFETHSQRKRKTKRSLRRFREPSCPFVIAVRRGNIGLKTPLLTEFFATAREDIIGHGFHQIGFSLSKEKHFDPDLVSRFKAIWEERIASAIAAHEKRVHELWTFGWWFAGDIFDDDWALERLAAVLKLTGKVEVDHLVAKRLVKTVPEASQN